MNKYLHMISAVALFTTIAVEAADSNEKTVFVTKASFKSNMGGLAGADAKCQAEADDPASIVPSGTYLPWLSDGQNSPDTRFTKSSHPYVRPDGTKIAENYTDLTNGSILNTISIDATGQAVGHQQFWTGTKADGTTTKKNNTCAAWGVDPPSYVFGMIGHTANKTTSWSSYRGYPCSRASSTYRLACFQQ
jgi:hypothetical protein